jgi:hypothetical protein
MSIEDVRQPSASTPGKSTTRGHRSAAEEV